MLRWLTAGESHGPELVAILHSFVGFAATLVGFASYLSPETTVTPEGPARVVHLVEIAGQGGDGAFEVFVVAGGEGERGEDGGRGEEGRAMDAHVVRVTRTRDRQASRSTWNRPTCRT